MPGILTSAEIAAMQSVIYNTVLPDTCNILGLTYTSDGAGGVSVGTAIVSGGSAIPCRCDPLSQLGQREKVGGAEGNVYDFVFTLSITAPIATDRQIGHNGHIYEIRKVSDDPSWLLCRRAHVARIE